MPNPIPHPPIRRLAAIVAGLLLGSAAAHAQEDGVEPIERLRSVAEQAVRASLPASAEVSADGIDPRLRLAACAATPGAEVGNARGARVSVTVRCAAPQAWTIYIPVQIRDLRQVPVLSRAVRRGEPFDATAVRLETRDVAQLPFGWLEHYGDDPAAYAEREFRRPIAAGQAPGPNDLAPARCVRRGERVTLIGRAAGIEVRTEGKAMADGARGDRIQVQNPGSKRIVEGTVTAPGVVETGTPVGPQVPQSAAASKANPDWTGRTRATMTSKINGNPGQGPVQGYGPAARTSATRATGSDGKVGTTAGSAGSGGDTVSLTDSALLLQETASAASAASGVDRARVDAVSRELRDGSYRVDPQAIATRLLKSEAEIYG